MKLTNPLYYPVAVLVSTIVFVLGIRVVRLPLLVVAPVAGAIAIAGSSWLKSREPDQADVLGFLNPNVERELQQLRSQAQGLALKANDLRQEATRLLTNAAQLDQLVSIQYACDRIQELPDYLTQLSQRLQGQDALLSLEDLRKQLKGVEQRLKNSDAIAREQLQRLANSLRRNIELAEQGTDAREAQLVSLSTLIQDAGGNLQLLQNKLRTTNLSDIQNDQELQALSHELSHFQENIDLLLS